MSEFEAQLAEQKAQGSPAQERKDPPGHRRDLSSDIPPDLLNDLIFNSDPSPTHVPPGVHGFHGIMPFDPFSFPFPIAVPMRSSTTSSPQGGAHLETILTDDKGDKQSKANGTVLEWGSEVELPTDSKVSPPKSMAPSGKHIGPVPLIPPTIHIQPPTDSNLGKSVGVPTASVAGTTRTGRTPGPSTTRSVEAQTPPQSGVRGSAGSAQSISLPGAPYPPTNQLGSLPETALPNPLERDMPPPPSESIRSNRPSTPQKSTPFGTSRPSATKSSPGHRGGDTPISLREALGADVPLPPSMASQSAYGPFGTIVDPSIYTTERVPAVPTVPSVPIVTPPGIPNVSQAPTAINFSHLPVNVPKGLPRGDGPSSTFTAYKSAFQSMPTTPPESSDMITIVRPDATAKPEPRPWDCVQQRLYSWAVVWEDSSFSHALEDISLGKQVGEFALSIFVMMTFKR